MCPAFPGATGLWSVHWTDGLYMHNKCHVFLSTDHLQNVARAWLMLPENPGQKYGNPVADALQRDWDQDFSKGFGLSGAADFSKSFRADAEQGLDSTSGSFGRTDAAHAGFVSAARKGKEMLHWEAVWKPWCNVEGSRVQLRSGRHFNTNSVWWKGCVNLLMEFYRYKKAPTRIDSCFIYSLINHPWNCTLL